MNSNGSADNATIDSCQYTPVYVIQNNSISQTRSYIVAPAVQEESRPVTSNLKLFYENSGNIENSNSIVLNNVQYVTNQTPANKQVQEPVGNNLKLASFLVPKKDATNKQYIATISNKVLKPSVNSSNANVLPNFNVVSSKPNGARSKANSAPVRTLLKPRILPKITPNDNPQIAEVSRFPAISTATCLPANRITTALNVAKAPTGTRTTEPSKLTSVHLLKLGGTYHSLNQLSESQMVLVNKALENLRSEPGNSLKHTYDPDTNTRIVYKIVSPNDLKVVGKSKVVMKTNPQKKEEKEREKEHIEQKIKKEEDSDVETCATEVTVTRSGRTVKLPTPKHIIDSKKKTHKGRKKKANMSCFQCSAEFASFYKLQRHYEKNPTHIPANIHVNLYDYLISRVKNNIIADKAAVFVQLLEELIVKLKSLLPCLLKNVEGTEMTLCNISENVGRFLGLTAGTYHINVDALSCQRDEHGHCPHNPPKPTYFNPELKPTHFNPELKPTHFNPEVKTTNCNPEIKMNLFNPEVKTIHFNPELKATHFNPEIKTSHFNSELNPTHFNPELKPTHFNPEVKPTHFNTELKPSQIWMTKHQEETAEEIEDCARINPIEKWHLKRQWKHKLEDSDSNDMKKMKLIPDATEPLIELGNETVDNFISSTASLPFIIDAEEDEAIDRTVYKETENKLSDYKKAKGHTQFYSTHFDIRSSPIKTSSTVFNKFQIIPEQVPMKFDPLLRPLNFDQEVQQATTDNSDNSIDLKVMFKELTTESNQDSLVNNIAAVNEVDKDIDVLNQLAFETHKEWTLAAQVDKAVECIQSASFMDHSSDLNTQTDYVNNFESTSAIYNRSCSDNPQVSDSIISDNRDADQGASVLNFLESLGNDCLACPETELRNNSIDFPLDLFSFSNP